MKIMLVLFALCAFCIGFATSCESASAASPPKAAKVKITKSAPATVADTATTIRAVLKRDPAAMPATRYAGEWTRYNNTPITVYRATKTADYSPPIRSVLKLHTGDTHRLARASL